MGFPQVQTTSKPVRLCISAAHQSHTTKIDLFQKFTNLLNLHHKGTRGNLHFKVTLQLTNMEIVYAKVDEKLNTVLR